MPFLRVPGVQAGVIRYTIGNVCVNVKIRLRVGIGETVYVTPFDCSVTAGVNTDVSDKYHLPRHTFDFANTIPQQVQPLHHPLPPGFPTASGHSRAASSFVDQGSPGGAQAGWLSV